jgi:hypothetical protein
MLHRNVCGSRCNRGRSNQRSSVGRQAQIAWDNDLWCETRGLMPHLLVVVEMPERRNQHKRLEAPGYGG